MGKLRRTCAWVSVLPIQPISGSGRRGEAGSNSSTHSCVAAQPDWGRTPRVRVPDDLHQALLAALSAWAADGSVVLVRQPDGDQARRLAPENITVDVS